MTDERLRTPAEQQAAVPRLQPCPQCERPTVLCDTRAIVAVHRDGTYELWGSAVLHDDVRVFCNMSGCGWMGTMGDLPRGA